MDFHFGLDRHPWTQALQSCLTEVETVSSTSMIVARVTLSAMAHGLCTALGVLLLYGTPEYGTVYEDLYGVVAGSQG